jgi:hypothetical protein
MWNEINQSAVQNENGKSNSQKNEQKSKGSSKNHNLVLERLSEILNPDLDLELEEDLKESDKMHSHSQFSTSTESSNKFSSPTDNVHNNTLRHVGFSESLTPTTERNPSHNCQVPTKTISNLSKDQSEQLSDPPKHQSLPSKPSLTASEMSHSQMHSTQFSQKDNTSTYLLK